MSQSHVIVLLYHEMDSQAQVSNITSADDLSVVVDIEDFRQQLTYLKNNAYNILTLDQMLQGDIPEAAFGKNVVITFDDGRLSDWTLATPALIEHGFPATFYVVSGRVDNDPEYVSSDNLREMHANGMTIGSHSVTHRFLAQLSEADVRSELVDSKKQLEDIIGAPVKHLALPGGHGNKRVFQLARECGYESVSTCEVDTYRVGSDPFHIPRLEIRRGLGIDEYSQTFSEETVLQLKKVEGMKSMLRKTLGLNNYTRLRHLAHSIMSLKR